MTEQSAPRCLVVMGVAGSGKSTLARALVRRTGWTMLEGDDLHPPENVAKMSSGIPLTDADRQPWLQSIAAWIAGCRTEGVDALVTCSALRRGYRDLLREASPGVVFCLLEVPAPVLVERLSERAGHYFPAQLLRTQLATLEPLEPDEPGFVVGGDAPEDVVAETVLDLLREVQVRP